MRSVGVKQSMHETYHLTPSSADVRNEWTYTSTLPYSFMPCTGTNLPFTGTALQGDTVPQIIVELSAKNR
jgi:hypothetical protein